MSKRILSTVTLLLVLLFCLPRSAFALSPSPGAQYDGIDVSKWQGDIDFAEVAASGIEIVATWLRGLLSP